MSKDIKAMITQTEDHLNLIQQAGVETERQIAELDARLTQLKHERIAHQARLATLKELDEPSIDEAQPIPDDIAEAQQALPPEVFEQVKNVLANAHEAAPVSDELHAEEEKLPKHSKRRH